MIVTLAAPWLAQFDTNWFARDSGLPATPCLDRWLRFARVEAAPATLSPWTSSLSLFGLEAADGGNIPWAPLSALGDGVDAGEASWVRIDPVHLRPDMARLRLFAVPDFGVTADEAEALAAIVREVLADWGELHLGSSERWYLKLEEPHAVTTTPLHQAVTVELEAALPRGESGPLWRVRLTEIQMRLFDSPVNRQREAQGAVAINGVWMWGMGKLPALPVSRYAAVFSESPVVRGAAIRSGVGRVAGLEEAHSWNGLTGTSAGEGLIWLEPGNPRSCGEPGEWGGYLQRIETQWAMPLMERLATGDIEVLHLLPGDGTRRSVRRADLRRFWRHRSPWHHAVEARLRSVS
ncbi:MAG: hypothetical protein Kow006_32350 [Gammaproteobacteria bacterium]